MDKINNKKKEKRKYIQEGYIKKGGLNRNPNPIIQRPIEPPTGQGGSKCNG